MIRLLKSPGTSWDLVNGEECKALEGTGKTFSKFYQYPYEVPRNGKKSSCSKKKSRDDVVLSCTSND